MELIGTVKKLTDIQTFQSGFQKREMILLTEEQYPQPISIEFLSDKINLLDQVSQGEKVKVGINIRGREWTNRRLPAPYPEDESQLHENGRRNSRPQGLRLKAMPCISSPLSSRRCPLTPSARGRFCLSFPRCGATRQSGRARR